MSENNRRRRLVVGRLAAQLAVIVVGVLLALWADAWVTARAERQVESARLEALKANVETTSVELRSFEERAVGTSEALRRLLAPEVRDRVLPPDTLRALVLRAYLDVPMFEPQMNVYEDLKSSGQLALLKDPEVRQALAAVDAQLRRIQLAQADLSTVQQLNLDAYAIRRMDFPLLQGSHLGLEVDEEALRSGDEMLYLADREFRNLVALKLDILMGISDVVERLESTLQRVDQAIAERLSGL